MTIFYFKSSSTTGYYIEGNLLEEIQTPYQNIQVIHNREMGNILTLDNHVMITQSDEHQYHELITHPNCLQLTEYKKALILGGGDGLSARELLKYPFEKITQIEIDKAVSDMTEKYFSEQLQDTLKNSRFEAIYTNGLAYFDNCVEKYNYISLDLTDPEEKPTHSNALYTKEFYQKAAAHLEQGILVIQTACPYLFKEHFKQNVSLFKELFTHVAIYGKYMRCYGTYQYFLAGSNDIAINNPNVEELTLQMKKFSLCDLKLYNPYYHLSLLIPNNEILNILET